MVNFLLRIVRFYVGWRLVLVAASIILGYIGLASDAWWSPMVAVLGVLPILVLFAHTALRGEDLRHGFDTHGQRLDASESRLGHAEDRDRSFERQFAQVHKEIKSAVAVTARTATETAATGVAPSVERSSSASTGQVMELYRVATGRQIADDASLVTVVLPCFNESRFIRDAIESLQAQTFENFVAIIVDDASTDDSVAVAFDAIEGDSRFHIVRHGINSGLSASRNTGLRLAGTNYVCFLDADDFFHRTNLEERTRHIIGWHYEEEVVGVYSGIEHIEEHVGFADVAPGGLAKHRRQHHDHLSSAGACPFNCHAPLIRTSVLQRIGGFDEAMKRGAEDWDCWQRLMRQGYVFHATPSVLAVYRQKAASMVRSMPSEHLAEADRLSRRVHDPLTNEHALPGSPFVFSEPLGHYQQQLQMAERVLSFLGLAHMTEDDDQLDRSIEQLDPAFWPIAARNLNVSGLLDVGIRRGFALDLEGFRQLDGKIAPIRTELLARLEEHAARAPQAVEDPQPLVEPDILFVPETSAHARRMIEVAGELSDSVAVAMLDVNILSGDSGVRKVLDESWTGDRLSLNSWSSSRKTPKVVAVVWPYGAITSSILTEAAKAGSHTVELVDPFGKVDRLPESNSAICDVTVETAAELEAQVDSADGDYKPMPLSYHVGPASRAAAEEFPRLVADTAELHRFKDIHAGERCVIIGNGPSLNDLDLARLRNEYTIGVNGIFYAESLTFPLSYYLVEDTSVMQDNLLSIKAYKAKQKFFPTLYRDSYGKAKAAEGASSGVNYFTMNRGFYADKSPNFCVPRFSTDASQRLFCGQSVTIINLQLAYYMGFSEVYLIGMDFSYTIPDTAVIDEDMITSTEDDPNHFHKDYFGKGKTWKNPKLDRVLNNYQMAKVMFEADGRAIYNATAGGKLEIFERRDFHEVFDGK